MSHPREHHGDRLAYGSFLSANPDAVRQLRAKAAMMRAMRAFLDHRGGCEVPVPVLQQYREGAPIHQFTTTHPLTGRRYYLRHGMHDYLRRLAAAVGPVYEIGKAVRVETEDTRRAEEFLLLVYAARDLDYCSGIDLVGDLLQTAVTAYIADLGTPLAVPVTRPDVVRWDDALRACLGFDSRTGGFRVRALAVLDGGRDFSDPRHTTDWEVLEDLMKFHLEPSLTNPTLLVDFPPALQHVSAIDPATGYAQRISLIVDGIEVCDGGVKFASSRDYRRIHDHNAAYRRDILGIDDNEPPDDFYRDVDTDGRTVFTFGMGVDRLAAAFTRRCIHEVVAFPCH